MNPGQIVEFIEEGRVVSGVCLEDRKGRVRTLTESQREVHLAAARLVHVSEERLSLNQPREALAQALRQKALRREKLSQDIDVAGLWEILHEDPEEYGPRDLAGLAFGDPVVDDQVSAVIRAMLADRAYFRFRVHGFRPNEPETVEKIFTQRAREEEKERQIQSGSLWIRALWEGREEAAPEGSEEILELLKEHAIYGKGAPRAHRCEEILRRAGMTHPLASFQVLVRLGVWSENENLALHRWSIRRVFPRKVLEEASGLRRRPLHGSREPVREDHRALDAFTIDSSLTRDVDDALSVEPVPGGHRVGIHISDVSAVVERGSPLDEEAALRGTSIYLPDQMIPMLPSDVSEDLCSLREGEVRAAISLFLDVDEGGEIAGHRFCRSWIQVKERLSYGEADHRIGEPLRPFATLLAFARARREERHQRGALLMPLPEVSVRVTGEGEILLERRDREGPSQILVSEMMIQANRLAAGRLKEAGIPCIYRLQAEPRERIMEGSVGDVFLNYRQRKLLTRAETQLDPGLHSGLGLETYAMLTSPIRRYQDLVLQRQLSASLRGATPPYTREDLQRILMETEELLAQAAQMEQSRQRYWLLKFLENRRGEETPALVIGRYGRRIQVLLTEYMLEVALPAASAGWLQEGQEISVRILRAKPMEEELKVELA